MSSPARECHFASYYNGDLQSWSFHKDMGEMNKSLTTEIVFLLVGFKQREALEQ